MVEYHQIAAPEGVKMFVFAKDGCSHAVVWHRTAACRCRIPLPEEKLCYTAEFGTEELPVAQTPAGVEILVENRHYLRTELPLQDFVAALEQTEVLE